MGYHGAVLRAILFDFNGVLVDDEPIHFERFRQVLAEEGIDLGWPRQPGGRFGGGGARVVELPFQ